MTIRLIRTADGRVVVVNHRAGELEEAVDRIARLLLDGQLAVRVPHVRRAVAPKGEER